MKTKKLIVALMVMLFAALTDSEAQTAPVKQWYTYNFPQGLIDSVKNLYVGKFEKGRIIYQMNCAKCHNKIKDSVEVIPEFSATMLASYEARFAFPRHEQTMAEMKVTPDELDKIMLFLTFLKKADKPVASK